MNVDTMSMPELAAYRPHAANQADDLSVYPAWSLDLAERGIQDAPPDLTRLGFDLTLPEPFCLACVATSILFITHGPVRRLRHPRRTGSTSYSWKHHAERWGRSLGFAPYVMNGDFIVACRALDIPVARAHRGPNAHVGLSLLVDLNGTTAPEWIR